MASSRPRNARSVYLITYSQANLEVVPSQTDFATIVKDALEKTGTGGTVVERWCYCRENHQDGNPHYHVAIKLNKQRRWLSARDYIAKHYNIQVNFSDKPGNYYEAWLYCTKSDREIVTSDNHPDFTRASRTTNATSQKRAAATFNSDTSREKRRKTFDALDLHHIVIQNSLRTKSQLLRFASKQMEDGKTDIALYVLNNTPRALKIMQTCWEMVESVDNEQREIKTRLQILEEVREGKCVVGCREQWKYLASQTLERNNCSIKEFGNAIKNALINGQGKGRNIMIVGPANCGKTFVLKPLCDIQRLCQPCLWNIFVGWS